MQLPEILEELNLSGFLITLRDRVDTKIYHQFCKATEPAELARCHAMHAALSAVMTEIQIEMDRETMRAKDD